MRPGAELLLIEAEALAAVLAETPPAAFDNPTVCTGWSVRDVLAHCGAALTAAATGDLHRFSPEDNQRDVDERRTWPLDDVLAELLTGYRDAATAIDAADGRLDGIAIGEWIHGGDVREAVGAPRPYASAGVELALGLLIERSRRAAATTMTVDLGDQVLTFGPTDSEPTARLDTDVETFVRLCGDRRPDPARYRLTGAAPADVVLFT